MRQRSLALSLYRAASWAMFAPFGGLDALRHHTLDALALGRSARVLELGCGPGDVTAALLAAGAQVHAVDSSSAMLGEAARRAPGATFEQADLRRYTPTGEYAAVLLAFVLHEVPMREIPGLVGRIAAALAPAGRVAVLDHAVPAGAAGWSWRVLLNAVEGRGVASWLALDLPEVLRRSGLAPTHQRELAGGRVRLTLAQRLPDAVSGR